MPFAGITTAQNCAGKSQQPQGSRIFWIWDSDLLGEDTITLLTYTFHYLSIWKFSCHWSTKEFGVAYCVRKNQVSNRFPQKQCPYHYIKQQIARRLSRICFSSLVSIEFLWVEAMLEEFMRISKDPDVGVWDLLRKSWLPLTASTLNSKTWKQMHRDAPDASEFFLKMDHFPNEIEVNTKNNLWNQHLVSLICGFHQPHIHISLHIVQPPHRIAHSIPQLHGRIDVGSLRMSFRWPSPLACIGKNHGRLLIHQNCELWVVPSTFTTVYS